MRINPGLPRERNEHSRFGAIIVLILEGSSFRYFDAQDFVWADDDLASILKLDYRSLGENFQGDYPALSTTSDHPGADGRQFVL